MHERLFVMHVHVLIKPFSHADLTLRIHATLVVASPNPQAQTNTAEFGNRCTIHAAHLAYA